MTSAELATHLRSLAAVLEAPPDEAIDVIDLAGCVNYLIGRWLRQDIGRHGESTGVLWDMTAGRITRGEAVNASGDSNRESVSQTTDSGGEALLKGAAASTSGDANRAESI